MLNIFYELDKAGYVVYSTSTEVSIASVGEHTLNFYGVDKAGNKESPQNLNFIILAETQKPVVTSVGGGGGNIGGGRDINVVISFPQRLLPEALPQVLGLATTTETTEAFRTSEHKLFLDQGTVYWEMNNVKRPFASQEEFLSYGFAFSEVKLMDERQRGLLLGEVVKARPGSLIVDVDRKLYIISENFEKQLFNTFGTAKRLGFDVSSAFRLDLKDYPSGKVVKSASQSHPGGSIIKQDKTFWWVWHNHKRPFKNWDSYTAMGLKVKNAVVANKYDMQLEEGEAVSAFNSLY